MWHLYKSNLINIFNPFFITFQASVADYKKTKQNLMEQADSLREDIVKLSKKMMKDPETVNAFLNLYPGYSKSTIAKVIITFQTYWEIWVCKKGEIH